MEGAASRKKPHMGRRRLVGVGLGLATLGIGLVVLADQAWVAAQLQPFLGSSLGSGGTPAAGLVPYGDLSFLVYAIGIGLIASGAGLVRSIFRSSVTGYVSGVGSQSMGMNPEALQSMMQASMTQMQTAAANPGMPRETVKVKCRNCGSLEAEDAAFCHKCGKPI